MKFLPVFTCLIFLFYVEAQNFCSPSLCKAGKKHIACGNNKAFAATCPKKVGMVNLKPHIQSILRQHNAFRNRIAGGLIAPYSPAANMATMAWNKQLASLAALNVKQCRMKHDECRNTAIFTKAGQNLAAMTTGAKKNQRKTVTFMIKNRINAWLRESQNANMAIINSYPSSYSGPAIGHFTQAVNEKAAFVGCAASYYIRNSRYTFLIACNYACTNIVDRPVYITSTKAASECVTGSNSVYPNLCSASEEYSF